MEYGIELIEWYDSFGCTSGWAAIEPIEESLVCKTVGFVVHENALQISLANSIAQETANTIEQANGVMTIPKASIKTRTKITSSSLSYSAPE